MISENNLLRITNCYVCGKPLNSRPRIFNSEINVIPEGLDRAHKVKSCVYRCNYCKSFLCNPIQEQKNYSESLCYEASERTLRNSAIFYPYSNNLIPDSLEDKIKDHVLVDFGCGAGFFTKEIKTYVKKVIGVDLDPNGIASLKKNNIEAHIGDLETLEKLKFNSLSMVGVIEHFKNPMDFLKSCEKILPKKNAAFLIYYPNPNSLSSFLANLSNNPWDMFLEPGHYAFPSKNYLISQMSRYGFKCETYWTTSNISRGKNPFGIRRNIFIEKSLRYCIQRYSFIKAIYVLLFKLIDFFKLGDIHCYFFIR